MIFSKSKEKVQPDFTTIELDYHGKQYAIFPSLFQRVKVGKETELKQVPAEDLASEARVQLKRYFIGKYMIDDQPPAKRIEDIVDDINLCFEPIKKLLAKYPGAISFNSVSSLEKKEIPYVINIDLTVLERFIHDLL